MDLTRADAIVQFTNGSANTWNNVNVPVPSGVVVIDTVSKVVKEGDGNTLFANLPVCLDYNFGDSTSGAVNPVGDDVGGIVIADDSAYAPSNIKLADILSSLSAKAAKQIAQQDTLNTLITGNKVLAVSEGVIDGTIVVCDGNGKYSPGDKTLAQLISDLILNAGTASSTMHIDDLLWYNDADLEHPVVTPNEVTERNTYWCKVSGFHDSAELRAVDFGMSTQTAGITITTSAKEETSGIIAAVYGGANSDQFYGVAVDSSDNIICAGSTFSEGTNSPSYVDALVVKFDSSLGLIARKRYGGGSSDQFNEVAVDSSNNIICVGSTSSEGAGSDDALVIKFDSNLGLIARKRYGGSGTDMFNAVAVDSSNNIICVGYTASEGFGSEALVVKFDSSLGIIARKRYGGISSDMFNAVAVDSSNNIICVGYTYSEGASSPTTNVALVIKFDSSLGLIARKLYGGSGNDTFDSVAVDSSNNIICAGNTTSEGAGSPSQYDALVVKFDSSLGIIARKRYGGSNADYFYGVAVDSSNNIICAGRTDSEGAGNNDALVVKFDSSLSIIARKRYGGSGSDYFQAIVVDSSNNIICAGSTFSEGAGSYDTLVIKLPATIPSGTITGTVLTGLTLSDSTLTLADSTLTLADSALTLANSALTLADSTLTLTDSNLTFEKDIITAGRLTVATKLITTIYTSSDDDRFTATTLDNSGNIIAVGATYLNGAPTALVVKFDANFTPIARKLYTGSFSNIFNSVAVDSSNNIIGIGSYTTTSGGYAECFIVKFNSTLASVIAHKTYGASGDDMFNDVILDPSGNFLCVGYTTSEGSGLKDGLVIKFNAADLSIAAKKRYGGAGNDVLNSIAIDSVGNAICVGWTGSEGANASGLILKLDANLNIVLRKIYNSTLGTTTEFNSVAITAANVIYCAGRVVMASGNKGLIVKFDSNINTTANKLYGKTSGNTEFTGIGKDSLDNIICVGKTSAEGAGNYDALILKLSSAMAILGRKTYGTIGIDANIDCTIDGEDDIIMSGYSVINGSIDAVLSKLPSSLPVGIYTNKYFTDLILSDSKLVLSDDNATVSNSTLTMADSSLVLTNGSMTMSNANGAIATDTTIMDAVSNVFKVEIGDIVTSGESVTPVFNVVTNDGDVVVGKNISVNVNKYGIIAAVYGGASGDQFQAVAVDSSNNIICVGQTNSEGTGSDDALVVKFDSSLNIIARKRYGGASGDYFYAVGVDSSNNIICAGITYSEGAGNADALVVKFDSSLNIIARKRYGGSDNDIFRAVAVDSSNNIICAGYTYSEGAGIYDALVVKFDSSLNIIARKRYGGSGSDVFQAVVVDNSNNIICVGYTGSEGSGSNDALVVKFAADLSIIARKRYGGTNDDRFNAVVVDSSNNIICVGFTYSEGAGNADALVVKFDSSLNIIARKRYGGANSDQFFGVAVDSSNNIICAGYTLSEGAGGVDALVVKFAADLSIIARKRYGGTNDEYFYGVVVDSSNNIICSGWAGSEGAGGYDGFMLKLPSTIPSGTFTGTVLTGLTLADSALTLADSTLTLADSNLTLADSALALADSALTLADSALILEKDILVV